MHMKHELFGTGAALLVIDLQRGLFARPTPVYAEEALLRNIAALASAARTVGVPVVFLRHSNKLLVPGTTAWELHPNVRPEAGDLLVDKTHGDAFEATTLDALLRERAVGTLYVTGLVTEGCVRATCLGGLKRGYAVVLVADAHSSFHREAASRVWEWNQKLAAQLTGVVPASEVDFANARKSEQARQPDAWARCSSQHVMAVVMGAVSLCLATRGAMASRCSGYCMLNWG